MPKNHRSTLDGLACAAACDARYAGCRWVWVSKTLTTRENAPASPFLSWWCWRKPAYFGEKTATNPVDPVTQRRTFDEERHGERMHRRHGARMRRRYGAGVRGRHGARMRRRRGAGMRMRCGAMHYEQSASATLGLCRRRRKGGFHAHHLPRRSRAAPGPARRWGWRKSGRKCASGADPAIFPDRCP